MMVKATTSRTEMKKKKKRGKLSTVVKGTGINYQVFLEWQEKTRLNEIFKPLEGTTAEGNMTSSCSLMDT